jgi:hypothetical protein
VHHIEDRPPPAARGPGVRAPRLTAFLLFVLLACIHTWPLATDPAHLSRIDNGDALLNMWAIAWVAHQLPRDPAHLFDANIFYPERRTLAYSEAMIVQGVLAMPITALGGSPVLAFNLVLLAGFALTGWSFCLLVHRWTGSWTAGCVSGSLAAFNAHVFVRIPHLQTFHVEFIALALFALDRVIAHQRARDALLLGAAFALEGLTSVYLLVFTAWALAFGVLARGGEMLKRRARPLAALALAGLVAAIALAPYLAAYYSVNQTTGFERTLAHAQRGAGSWQDYLATASRLHYPLWSASFVGHSIAPAFPGVLAIVLVVLAVVWPDTRRDRRMWMCAAAAIGCAALSMLPRTSIFPLVYPWIAGLKAIRIVARVDQVVLLMIAVVAGFGLAGLQRRAGHLRAWPAVAVLLVAVVNVEAYAPPGLRRFTQIPPIYDVLRGTRSAVVIELPFHPPDVFNANAGYMLNSTRYWHPLLNGYSGFQPPSYAETFKAVQSFPDAAALTALHERGVSHVVVHADAFRAAFGNERFAALERTPSLTLLAEDVDIQIYRLR